VSRRLRSFDAPKQLDVPFVFTKLAELFECVTKRLQVVELDVALVRSMQAEFFTGHPARETGSTLTGRHRPDAMAVQPVKKGRDTLVGVGAGDGYQGNLGVINHDVTVAKGFFAMLSVPAGQKYGRLNT